MPVQVAPRCSPSVTNSGMIAMRRPRPTKPVMKLTLIAARYAGCRNAWPKVSSSCAPPSATASSLARTLLGDKKTRVTTAAMPKVAA